VFSLSFNEQRAASRRRGQGNSFDHSCLGDPDAGSDDTAVQSALQDAYESGELRGQSLQGVRRLLASDEGKKRKDFSTNSLVRSYQKSRTPETDGPKGRLRPAASALHRDRHCASFSPTTGLSLICVQRDSRRCRNASLTASGSTEARDELDQSRL